MKAARVVSGVDLNTSRASMTKKVRYVQHGHILPKKLRCTCMTERMRPYVD